MFITNDHLESLFKKQVNGRSRANAPDSNSVGLGPENTHFKKMPLGDSIDCLGLETTLYIMKFQGLTLRRGEMEKGRRGEKEKGGGEGRTGGGREKRIK